MSADNTGKQSIAIVIPHPQHLQSYLANNINTKHELAALCEDPVVKDIVRSECKLDWEKEWF